MNQREVICELLAQKADRLARVHPKRALYHIIKMLPELDGEGLKLVIKTNKVWKGMNKRCFCTTCDKYPYYGGRGISMSCEWRASFSNFILDMGVPPTLDHSIERIDNNQSYRLSNCRWATKKEQMRNKRSNRIIKMFGVKGCVSELCERFGFNESTIWSRITRGQKLDAPLRTWN